MIRKIAITIDILGIIFVLSPFIIFGVALEEVVLERKYLFHYTGIGFLIFVTGLFILFVGAVFLVLRYPEHVIQVVRIKEFSEGITMPYTRMANPLRSFATGEGNVRFHTMIH